MLKKALGAVSWVYHSYLEPIVLPWGYRNASNYFFSYLITPNYLIKGMLFFYDCKELTTHSIDFNYIRFEDRLSVENRNAIQKTYRFHFCIEDVREISFYDSFIKVMSDTYNPIDISTLNIKCDCVNIKNNDESQNEGIYFCRIILRIPIEKDDGSFENCFIKKEVIDLEHIYTFCFGLPDYGCVFLNCHISKLFPIVQINKIPQQQTNSILITTTSNTNLSTMTFDNEIIKNVSDKSKIFTQDTFYQLFKHLPCRAHVQTIHLIYSTLIHGVSINTFYRLSRDFTSKQDYPPLFLIVIKDFNNTIFGAVLNEMPTFSSRYYGTGESFVFSFLGDVLNVYHWSKSNEYFVYGTDKCFFIGSESGHNAIWLDDKLFNGRSESCSTFNSPCLSTTQDFKCQILELWSFSVH